ncbi:MAG TPA: SoxR reducing system RseC family protein [Gammaproteobacteria bacterium]|nr:SoxR reducing system RseC family protein [Gammaproteobacteria bacterium]
MITEQAVVTRCEGEKIEVRLLRESACGDCELSQGCGTGALGRLLGNRSRPLSLECSQPVQPGDRLELGLSESALVGASLTIYGLPLLGMLLAGLAAALGGFGDVPVALWSIFGLCAGIKFALWKSRRLERGRLTPYIVDIRLNPRAWPKSRG